MKALSVLLVAAAALPLATVFAQSGREAPRPAKSTVQASARPGSASPTLAPSVLYKQKCAMCHDKVGMGTGLLARRIQPAELLQRRDLQADVVEQAVRIGIGNMPALPRGELSDRELKIIADWLATPPERR